VSRRLLGLLLGLAALFLGLGVPATASASSGSEPGAVALLERALRAQDALAYSGVQQVWDRGGAMRTVGISHQPGSGTLLEVEDAADGGQAAGFVIGAEQPAISPAAILGLLASSYRLAVTGTEPVAGRSAVVIGATDDEGRPMARFWVDAATGLLLRREVFDANGQLQRSSGFEQVTMTVGRVQHLPPLLPAAHGPGLQQVDLATWCRRGWTCLNSIGRLQLVDARPVEDTGSSTLHLTYSDGLNVVSVFEELGRLPSQPLAGSAAAVVDGHPVRVFTGSPERVVWSGAGQVFTVVTDAPPEVVEAVVAALPHSTSADTLWSRLHRGGARVVSWLNPFG
jgi:sigma-E factor negative regulatory protein RseB